MVSLVEKVVRFQHKGAPLMSCTPVQKAAKPVWAKQLTEDVKFQFVCTTKSKNGQSAFAGFPQFPRPTLRGI